MQRDTGEKRGTSLPCKWTCGVCAAVCPSWAIEYSPGSVIIDLEKCTRCGICARVCPCGVFEEGYFARL